ncbi:MAG: hypothetical protein OEN00_14780 [Gemmatimonadota bacterium]|nr:hypothetical protein [Gemmatimonadota bacterium]
MSGETMGEVTLVGGERIIAHPASVCAGEICCIHNPSDHHMVEWPQHWRSDAGKMERLCPHGIGHPDPDEIEWLIKADPQRADQLVIHGCDGCCGVTPS